MNDKTKKWHVCICQKSQSLSGNNTRLRTQYKKLYWVHEG